jgi:hypothetical protein
VSFDTIPANTFPLYIQTAPLTFVKVGGLNTITLSPSKKEADTTTFDNAGWDSSTVVSRGLTVKGAGHALYDPSGAKDPGQVACEGYATEIGTAARATFEIRTPGSHAYRFTGDVTVTAFGGGANDVAAWDVEIKVSAEPTVETVA